MLGWLILFTFLTGAFSGSTLLFGLCIILDQRSDRNRQTKENLEEHDRKMEDLPPGTILTYDTV